MTIHSQKSIHDKSRPFPFPALHANEDYQVRKEYRPEDRIYRMRNVFDDVRFRSFRIPGPRRESALFPTYDRAYANPSQLNRIKKSWKPLRVEGDIAIWNECP